MLKVALNVFYDYQNKYFGKHYRNNEFDGWTNS